MSEKPTEPSLYSRTSPPRREPSLYSRTNPPPGEPSLYARPAKPASPLAGALALTGDGGTLQANDIDRSSGTYILGAPRMGKSVLLENLIVADMRAGRGVCVLDPHVDLTARVLRRVPPAREKDVVILDPTDVGFPFSLNLFHCPDPDDQLRFERAVDEGLHVFKKLWGPDGSRGDSWGESMARLFRNAAYALALDPEATLLELPLLLEDDEARARLAAPLAARHWGVYRFWMETFPAWSREAYDRRVDPVTNKVTAFTDRPTLRNIIGQSRPKKEVDFRELMAAENIVVVPLPAGVLGEEGAELLGSVVVGKILTAALSRMGLPERDRAPFHLYADEYQHFATRDFAEIIAQTGKYHVHPTVAHQYREQLDAQNRAASLAMGNLVFFKITGANAREVAGALDNHPRPGEPTLAMVTRPVGGGLRAPVKDIRYESTWEGEQRVEDTLYEWRAGPPRESSAIEAETANRLGTQDPYEATGRMRIGDRFVEHTLRTFPSPLGKEPTPAELARIDAMYAATRQTYGRSREVVEREVRERLGVDRLVERFNGRLPGPAPQPPGTDTRARGGHAPRRRSGRTTPGRAPGEPPGTPPWEPLEPEAP